MPINFGQGTINFLIISSHLSIFFFKVSMLLHALSRLLLVMCTLKESIQTLSMKETKRTLVGVWFSSILIWFRVMTLVTDSLEAYVHLKDGRGTYILEYWWNLLSILMYYHFGDKQQMKLTHFTAEVNLKQTVVLP